MSKDKKPKKLRNWMITVFDSKVNDPKGDPLAFDKHLQALSNNPDVRYICYQVEDSEDKNKHYQIYIEYNKPQVFNVAKSHFHETAHLEGRKGSRQQCRDYCMKEESRVHGPYEFGVWIESGQRVDLERMVTMVREGATDYQVMEENQSGYARYHKHLDKCRQVELESKFASSWMPKQVTYISGTTGCGKTRYVYDRHGYESVFRITNRSNPFDGYAGQPIMVFDEFTSSAWTITDMLVYLDGHPIILPCRYADKVACYDTVYIISNDPYEWQYQGVQENNPTRYAAWDRRINDVIVMDAPADASVSTTRGTPFPFSVSRDGSDESVYGELDDAAYPDRTGSEAAQLRRWQRQVDRQTPAGRD